MNSAYVTKPNTSVRRRLASVILPVQRASELGLRIFSTLPNPLQCKILADALNHALASLIADGEFDFLIGKYCQINVTDRNDCWLITSDGKLFTVEIDRAADVSISASSRSFLKLICHRSDPDTLFFDRELLIEGDVALGLHIKNLLDALDEDELNAPWPKALSTLRNLTQFEYEANDN